jgi:F1F0 ATPase subunit 2
MTTLTSLVIAFAKGTLLAWLFFYILWFSTQKILGSSWSTSWFIGSWLIRMLIAIGGFYLISMGNSMLLVASLCGFICARFLVAKLVKVRSISKKTCPYLTTVQSKGAKHAP